MNFDGWTTSTSDALRRKRLLAGYGVGLVVVTSFAGMLVLTSPSIAQETEETVVDVQLAKTAEPEPEPEPEPVKVAARPQAASRPKMFTPTEVPKEKPAEKDVKPGESTGGDADPFANAGDEPAATRTVASAAPPPPPPKAAPPPPPPKPAGPRVSATIPNPPTCTKTPPSGIVADGRVIFSYTVSETGAVTSVRVLRGPDEAKAAVIAHVKTWRCTPGHDKATGRPVDTISTFAFNFKANL